MKIIPYTLIAHPSYYTRAILEVLKSKGLAFEKIIAVFHRKYLGQLKEQEEANKKELVEIQKVIFENAELQIPFFEPIDFENYTQNLEVIDTFPFFPEELKERLDSKITYFFSYLGICPSDFLERAKILHIHSGIIPPIRGSHCLFWSLLYRGVPGYSLFYLSNGIDCGEVVYRHEFREALPNLSSIKYPLPLVTQSLLSYYDTYLRARVFANFLLEKTRDNLTDLSTFKHKNREFFSMDLALQKATLEKFFQYRA